MTFTANIRHHHLCRKTDQPTNSAGFRTDARYTAFAFRLRSLTEGWGRAAEETILDWSLLVECLLGNPRFPSLPLTQNDA